MQKNNILLITTSIIILTLLTLNITTSQELTNPAITITKINFTNNNLNIIYNFNNNNFIGDEIILEAWITNESGTEVDRLSERFSINRDPPIERDIFFIIPNSIIKQSKKSNQIIYINIAPSSDLNNPTKQVFTIQKPDKSKTPLSVNKTLTYLILFIILIITIFILINISKRKLHNPHSREKHENNSLLPKK